jgi:hypothetical protein
LNVQQADDVTDLQAATEDDYQAWMKALYEDKLRLLLTAIEKLQDPSTKEDIPIILSRPGNVKRIQSLLTQLDAAKDKDVQYSLLDEFFDM